MTLLPAFGNSECSILGKYWRLLKFGSAVELGFNIPSEASCWADVKLRVNTSATLLRSVLSQSFTGKDTKSSLPHNTYR